MASKHENSVYFCEKYKKQLEEEGYDVEFLNNCYLRVNKTIDWWPRTGTLKMVGGARSFTESFKYNEFLNLLKEVGI